VRGCAACAAACLCRAPCAVGQVPLRTSALEPALAAMSAHLGSLPAVEAGLALLRNLATNPENQVHMLHVVAAIDRALEKPPGLSSPVAAEHAMACLLNLAVDESNKVWETG
jgi:hypothetical protein